MIRDRISNSRGSMRSHVSEEAYKSQHVKKKYTIPFIKPQNQELKIISSEFVEQVKCQSQQQCRFEMSNTRLNSTYQKHQNSHFESTQNVPSDHFPT